MLSFLKERRARSTAEAHTRADLKARVESIFDLGPEDAVAVSEIACQDPGCPGTETVILVMRAGQPTSAMKLPTRMAEVSDIDSECLLSRPPTRWFMTAGTAAARLAFDDTLSYSVSTRVPNRMPDRDPFLSSTLVRPATHRLAVAAALVASLWATIWWAVSLP